MGGFSRPLAALHAAAAAAAAALFVHALDQRRVRPALLVYGSAYGLAAAGLWLRRAWGRMLALVLALGNTGLGLLTALGAAARGEAAAWPAAFAAANAALTVLVARDG